MTRFVPPGFRIEIFERVIVTLLIQRLMRWPAVPAKVAVEVVPYGVTVTTTAEPPGTIV